MFRTGPILGIVGGVALALAGGCAPSDPFVTGERYERPVESLVFPAKRVRLAQADAGDVLPWYASRNDERLGVVAGYKSGVYEHVTTLTLDQQSHHGDHVHDHYSQRTYHFETYEAVR